MAAEERPSRSAQEGRPLVTRLSEDRIIHDLAVGVEIVADTFTPSGPTVMIDVDAAYSFLGNARAALILYIGQPDTPGMRLYDSGGLPVDGAQWHSVASVNGESAWAHTTHRRLVLDVEPGRPVTWQILAGIIGGAATIDIPAPRELAITPDGTRAFVTSPAHDAITPIRLGRPGYSYDHTLKPQDTAQAPVKIGGAPTALSCDDGHVVVSCPEAGQVTVLSAVTNDVLAEVAVGGPALGSALTPDGAHALVGTGDGRLVRVGLPGGAADAIELSGRLVDVGVLPDGVAAYVADASGQMLHRVGLPRLEVEAVIALDHPPLRVAVAPDGQVWVLCRPSAPAASRLLQIDPGSHRVVNDYELPFPDATDVSIVPVAGQSDETVRTAWVVYEGGRYSQFNIGGVFAGQAHSIHVGALAETRDGASAIATSDYGEIWVVQPDLDRVWKWPGGRFLCRADAERPYNGVFFGEYCDVAVYGAHG